MPSIDGLVTGINTTSVIDGLLSIQKKRIALLQGRQQEIVARQTAFGGLEAKLLALKNSLGSLARTQNNIFQTRTVQVSDASALAATATSQAAIGVYHLRVNALAKAHQVASQGLGDASTEITQGTLQIQVGSGAVRTITVDGTNNTLQGLADTINVAGAGVSASLVRDGSGGSTPYRLLLTSTETGTSHAISLTNNLGDTTATATKVAFDVGNPVQAAANASVTLGTGAGAITVESSTNRVDNLIAGVNIDLLAADSLHDISVQVQRDVAPAKTAVQDFVDAYNDLMSSIDDAVKYNSETREAGVLLGNRDAIDLQDTVRRAVLGVVPGVNASMNRLSSIGISVTDSGKLTLNASRLDDVLAGRVAGVAANDVQKLFSLVGTSDQPNVRFVLGSSRTRPSSTPYQVDVTQAPERAAITAAGGLGATTVIDGTNNTLALTIDGADSGNLQLAAGSYTPAELVAQLQAVIDASDALASRSVTVSLDSGHLRITSLSYGLSSQVAVTGGTAVATLGFNGDESDFGQDVAGSFVVEGVTELATGHGRLLSGNVDNAHTADLQLQVTLTSAQVVPGPDANVTITQGLASRLDTVLAKLLDPVTGRVKQVDDTFDDQKTAMQDSIDRLNARFAEQQQQLTERFAALESAISQLQSTGNLLGSQLASLSSLRSSGK